jgi:protein SCO1/2
MTRFLSAFAINISLRLLPFICLASSTAPALAERPFNLQDEISLLPRIGDSIPRDLVFRDSTGRQVALGDYLNQKPIVLTPVYYRCPMLCGLELQGLVRCLKAMEFTAGQEFEIVTFSIDPRERPQLAAEKKANYLEQYGRARAEQGWHFLTGDQNSIDALCNAIGFRSRFDPETGEYAHAAVIVILTPEGQIARYLTGVEFAPRDLRMSLVEASEHRLARWTDRVLLFCFAYDHTQGKYALAIFTILRAAGLVTAVTLFGGIAWLIRREKQIDVSNQLPSSGPDQRADS